MKKLRLFGIIMAIMLCCTMLPVFYASAEGKWYYETNEDKGVVELKVFASDETPVVESARTGEVAPGMEIYTDGYKIFLKGVPTAAGNYYVEISYLTDGGAGPSKTQYIRVIVTDPAPGAGAPTIKAQPAEVKVNRGSKAVFKVEATGEGLHYEWRMVEGGTSWVVGTDSPTLTFDTATLDKSYKSLLVWCVVTNDGGSVTSAQAALTINSDPPVITKHPGGETVDEGDGAYFTAYADFAESQQWSFISPDGKTTVVYDGINKHFPDMKVTGGTTNKLTLSNIPYEFDGWNVDCNFTNEFGSTRTKSCAIKVNEPEPSPTPSPTPTPTPTPTVKPTATPEPEIVVPEPTEPAEPAHEHSFGAVWMADDNSHWHQCECGERSDEGSHDIVWTVTQKATKKTAGLETGICSVCNYTTTRPIDKLEGGGNGLLIAVVIVVGVVALAAIGAVVYLNVRGKK